MKDKINEILAVELMGWIVHDSSSSSYKDETNMIISEWNPYDNIQHSIWALNKLKDLGMVWMMYPSLHGKPIIQINKIPAEGQARGREFEGEHVCHNYALTPSIPRYMCYVALAATGRADIFRE